MKQPIADEELARKLVLIEKLHDDNARDEHPSFERLARDDADQVVR